MPHFLKQCFASFGRFNIMAATPSAFKTSGSFFLLPNFCSEAALAHRYSFPNQGPDNIDFYVHEFSQKKGPNLGPFILKTCS